MDNRTSANRAAPTQAAVVICTYTEERWDDLLVAIKSVKAQAPPPDEVILCVDHNEALEKRLRDHFHDITVLGNTGRQGLSGARNTGATHATAQVVVFLDDDAEAPAEWLGCLLTPFEDPLVMVSGTAVEPSWDNGRPAWWPREFDWVVGCSYRGLPETRQEVRNVIGCSMAIRRTAFDRVGLFTQGIGRVGTKPVGCEETELCIRIRANVPKARVVYCPEVAVRHRVPTARSNISYFLSRCYAEGLSKAFVAALTGSGDALSSERNYVRDALATGLTTSLADSVRRKPGAIGIGAAIVIGFGTTTVGYCLGRLALKLHFATPTGVLEENGL